MKGADAEARAARHLQRLGRNVVAQNYRIRGGEIDLVTLDGPVLVFTEVRHRSTRYGGAAASVTPQKLALMHRAAQSYLLREHGREDLPCRLEVLTIDGPAETGLVTLIPVDESSSPKYATEKTVFQSLHSPDCSSQFTRSARS
jgi:putative endonuclease